MRADSYEGDIPKDVELSTVDASGTFEVGSGALARYSVDLTVSGSVGKYPLTLSRRGTNFGLWSVRSSTQYQPDMAYFTLTRPSGDEAHFESEDIGWTNSWSARDTNLSLGIHSTGVGSYRAEVDLPDGGRVVCDQSPQAYDFRVSIVRDPHGLEYTYEYPDTTTLVPSRIVDPSGRWISFIWGVWPGAGVPRPLRADSSDGGWVAYTWDDTAGRMSIAYADGTVGFADYYRLSLGQWSYDEPRLVSGVNRIRVANVAVDYSQVEQGSGGYNWPVHYGKRIIGTVSDPATGTVFASRSLRLGSDGLYHSDEVTETRGDGASRMIENTMMGEIAPWNTAMRPTRITDFRGNATHFEYDPTKPGSRIKKVTDARGNITQYARDNYFGHIIGKTHPDLSVESWEYANGVFVTRYTDPRGNITNFTRDARGLITRIDYPDASFETWSGFNSFNQPTVHRLRNGAQEWFDYDAMGRLTRKWQPSFSGQMDSIAFTYYPDGHVWEDRVMTETDPRGKVTTFQYDLAFANGVQGTTPCSGRGLVTRITNHDGTYKSFGYDRHGNKTWEENELRQRTSYTYDAYNRVVSMTDPLNRTTTYEYQHEGFSSNPLAHTANKPRFVIHPSGRREAFTYDADFRLLTETKGWGTADASTITRTYDSVGNLSSETDGVGRTTTFSFDSRNRRTTQTAPLGRITRWEYDTVSNVTRVTNPDGTASRAQHDAMNRVRYAWDERDQMTEYTYHASGRVHHIIDPRGSHHAHDYDASDRLTRRWYPNPAGAGWWHSSEQWTYDAAGNLSTHTNRSGHVLRYYYDDRNREFQRDWDNYAAPSVWTTYDPASRVLTRMNWHATLTYAFNAAGEVTSETQKIHGPTGTEDGRTVTLGFSYDVDGNRVAVESTAGTWVGYAYNARHQVREVQQGSPASPIAWATYQFNAAGERRFRTHFNNTVSDYNYDGAGRLNYLHTYRGSDGSWILMQQFGHDLRDRRTWAMRDQQYGDTWRYLDDSQLMEQRTHVWRPDQNFWNAAAFTDTFAYDAAGNRTSWNQNGAVTSYAADALNQYTSVTGLTIQHGDGRGNITQHGGWSFQYDADNRLQRAVGPGHDIWPHYDGQGRLCKIVDNGTYEYRFHDGSQTILRTTQGGTWIDFTVWGTSPDEVLSRYNGAHGWIFFHQDPLNSTVAVTDINRNVVERYLYDAFGAADVRDANWGARSSSAIANRWLFTGQEWWPEMGLHNYKARFYSSELGRFLQHDPIRFDAGDLNLYRYVSNDSINRVDPLGLEGDVAPLDQDSITTPALEASTGTSSIADRAIQMLASLIRGMVQEHSRIYAANFGGNKFMQNSPAGPLYLGPWTATIAVGGSATEAVGLAGAVGLYLSSNGGWNSVTGSSELGKLEFGIFTAEALTGGKDLSFDYLNLGYFTVGDIEGPFAALSGNTPAVGGSLNFDLRGNPTGLNIGFGFGNPETGGFGGSGSTGLTQTFPILQK